MGKLVNVILPGGRVVSVPEEVASKIAGNDVAHTESLSEASGRSTSELNKERSAGVVEGIKAAGEGFADAATLGAYGRAINWADPAGASNMEIRAQERPGARLAGELGAVLAPTGALGKTAKAVGEVLPVTALGNSARAIGGTAGRLAEGAVYGAGGSIATANVTGDPLSIEGIVKDAGIGALLNFGLSKLGDGLSNTAKRSKAIIAAEQEAEKAANLFESTPESYNELVSAHKATVQEAKVAQKAWDKASQEYYKEFQELGSDPKQLRGLITQVDVTERKILNQLAKGKRLSEFPLKDIPGQFATELTESDRATLSTVKKILADGRTAATKAFGQGSYGITVSKLADAIENAKNVMPGLDLPALPTASKFGQRPSVPEILSLPKDLRGFAKLHPDTIAKLANEAVPNGPVAQAIEKLTADLGLEASNTAGATIAGTHAKLQSMANSVVQQEAGGKSLLDTLRLNSKRAIRYGFGRMADTGVGGGFLGASARTVVGGLVGYGLDGTEGALIGSALMNAKSSVRSKMVNMFARYGEGAAKVVSGLGPVTSYLATEFPSGEQDKSKDIREQALNRVNDFNAIVGSVNDVSFSTVQPLMNQPGDIGFKIHTAVVNAVQAVVNSLPKDPGLATNMFNSYWKPAHHEALKLAYVIEAVLSPDDAIKRLIAGKSDPVAANTLWNVWPAHMQEAATELVNNAQFMGNLTREQSSALSALFRVPLNGFRQPQVMAQLQSYYLPKPPVNSGPSPSRAPTGNPNGRPPAIKQSNPSQSRVSQLQR